MVDAARRRVEAAEAEMARVKLEMSALLTSAHLTPPRRPIPATANHNRTPQPAAATTPTTRKQPKTDPATKRPKHSSGRSDRPLPPLSSRLPRRAAEKKPAWDASTAAPPPLSSYSALYDPDCPLTKTERFKRFLNQRNNSVIRAEHDERRRLRAILSRAHAEGSEELDAAGDFYQPPPEELTDDDDVPDKLPRVERVILRAIKAREHELCRLHAILMHAPHCSDELRNVQLRESLARCISKLRLCSLAVVESIVRWRKRRPFAQPFLWRDHDYLLKMLVDVYFANLYPSIAHAAADPFLLQCFGERPREVDGTLAARGPIRIFTPGTSFDQGHAPIDPLPLQAPTPQAQQLVARYFAPALIHSRRDLVRMWSAERVLAAASEAVGFAPIPPTLETHESTLRHKAHILFFGSLPRASSPQAPLSHGDGSDAGDSDGTSSVSASPSLVRAMVSYARQQNEVSAMSRRPSIFPGMGQPDSEPLPPEPGTKRGSIALGGKRGSLATSGKRGSLVGGGAKRGSVSSVAAKRGSVGGSEAKRSSLVGSAKRGSVRGAVFADAPGDEEQVQQSISPQNVSKRGSASGSSSFSKRGSVAGAAASPSALSKRSSIARSGAASPSKNKRGSLSFSSLLDS